MKSLNELKIPYQLRRDDSKPSIKGTYTRDSDGRAIICCPHCSIQKVHFNREEPPTHFRCSMCSFIGVVELLDWAPKVPLKTSGDNVTEAVSNINVPEDE